MQSDTPIADRDRESSSRGREGPVVSIRGLGKYYRMFDSQKDKVKEVLCLGRRAFHRKFWALRNISLDVERGETVGIVGRNGSGKSTLLQLICGTVTPSDGTIDLYGTVAALLELGAGFHPEFTGKENVYMNATILGMSRAEIDEKYDSIVDFADIGPFIDQPVRSYSSGMYVRLAFSVAVNVEPDILVVDEALAVGDEMFQRKCYSRIRAISDAGTTILFVSHSPAAIYQLCDRAILLDNGEAIFTGLPKVVISRYQRLISAPAEGRDLVREEIRASVDETLVAAPKTRDLADGDEPLEEFFDENLVSETSASYVSRGAKIHEPAIMTPGRRMVNHLVQRRWYIYTYNVEFYEPAHDVNFAMRIKNVAGVALGGYKASRFSEYTEFIPAGTRAVVSFRFQCLLCPGTYFLNSGVTGTESGVRTYLDRRLDAAVFKVQPSDLPGERGTVDFMIEPSVEFHPIATEESPEELSR